MYMYIHYSLLGDLGHLGPVLQVWVEALCFFPQALSPTLTPHRCQNFLNGKGWLIGVQTKRGGEFTCHRWCRV